MAFGQVQGTVEFASKAAVITTITDSTGLSGSHDDTLGATAALVTITDSTGLSGTHDDTLDATAALTTLTDSTGDSGTHDDVVADGLTVGAITAYSAHAAGGTTVTSNAATDLDTTAAALATLVGEVTTMRADLAVQNQNTSDITQKVIELVTRDQVHAQNVSDLGQKVIEIVAQLAVTNQNISDLGQKMIEVLANLKSAGLMASS